MENGREGEGGVILAAAIIAGVVGGTIVGEPSAGFLTGLVVGLAVLAIFWLRRRRRIEWRGVSGDPAAGPDHPADNGDPV